MSNVFVRKIAGASWQSGGVKVFDVVIVGGGISGCSLLYKLSQYKDLSVLLVEKENDVGVGTTKANSAIVHAGYDPHVHTLMARYNVQGNDMVRKLCQDLDVLYKQVGSLVVALQEDQIPKVEELYNRGQANKVPMLRIVQQPELSQMEPNLNPKAICALHAPTAGIVNIWELAFAQAEVAVQNGCDVRCGTKVNAISKRKGYFALHTSTGDIEARFVVNASGVNAANVAGMLEEPDFTMHPNRGQYYLMDTSQGNLASRIVFQCPTKNGKGVLVAPTVHGNLIVGPNAEPVQGDDTSTTAEGQTYVRKTALLSFPTLDFSASIRNFAGVRATSSQYDFIVGESKKTENFFHMAGIKSPGLTSAPAIAQDIVKMLGEKGLPLIENSNAITSRHIVRIKYLSQKEKDEAIRKNPLYGNIVCRCETVTEGEIVDALRRPLAPCSIDAVKRRTSAGLGRCQGGFCGPRVQAIVAEELGIPIQEVPQDRKGMQVVLGETKLKEGGK